MATTVLGLKTFAASDPVDYNEINDNYNKIDTGVKTAFQGRAAHDWLDNSNFRIAQAGYGGMHGTQKYACDRWYDTYGFGSFSFDESQGLTIAYGTNHAYLVQKIDGASLLHGKYVTLACQLSDGTVYVNSGVFNSSGESFQIVVDSGKTFTLYSDRAEFVVTSGSMTIKWAALYEGSYTAETLPAYQPKGYAAELAECQRYYVHCGEASWMTGLFKVGEGLIVEIPTANNIRIPNPTIIVNSPKVFTTNGWYDITYASCTVTKCWTKLLFNFPEAASQFMSYYGAYIITGIVGVSADL